jgi:hypothetical protein
MSTWAATGTEGEKTAATAAQMEVMELSILNSSVAVRRTNGTVSALQKQKNRPSPSRELSAH